MKTKFKEQRGTVLVVALIMLSMVTLLVVALVGFSRDERASVTASMIRTEIGFVRERALMGAQGEMIDLMMKNINHGTKVSQNIDGVSNTDMPADLAALVAYATGQNQPRPPVYVDRKDSEGNRGKDGNLDTFQFYWDLNSATDPDGNTYQNTYVNALGVQVQGDPHWIGILEKPDEPHGPDNEFVARYASMTVPVHKSLNIRYHHNDLKVGDIYFDRYNRLQGLDPKEINLAAPLGWLDQNFFQYQAFNPLLNAASFPAAPSLPDRLNEGLYSAFSFASALNHFGYDIEDAIYLSQPSIVHNGLFGQYRKEQSFNGFAVRQLDGLKGWLTSKQAAPYSYYQFMELFSSTPLPAEPEKFDVNAIRDEIVNGFAYVDTTAPEYPLTFLQPHGLEDGDKLEWAGSTHAPPIADRITFELMHENDILLTPEQNLEQKRDRWVAFIQTGNVQTEMPHRLLRDDLVQMEIAGIGGGLTLLHKDLATDPFTPVFSAPPSSPTQKLRTYKIINSVDDKSLIVQTTVSLKTIKVWGVWDSTTTSGLAVGSAFYLVDFTDLPADFANATLKLHYRYYPFTPIFYQRLDPIPYFAKVISPTSVSLHRSAELDELDAESKVKFASNPLDTDQPHPRLNPVSPFNYNPGNFVFTGTGPLAQFFINNDFVRFKIADGATLETSLGPINGQNVFILNNTTEPNQFKIYPIGGTSNELKMSAAGSYTLQVVHRFKKDGLTAAMEKMAGLMLNESLDTTGDGPTTGSHSLGGQPLPQEMDPADLLNPAPPFPLKMGIGGHPEALDDWHHPKKGIAWGTSLVPGNPEGRGRYTREMERIVQVSANIADLYSGYGGLEFPFTGKEMLTCKSTGRNLLPFGRFSRDARVSARIRQSGGYSGLVLCMRTDKPNPIEWPAFEVRYIKEGDQAHVELWIWKGNPATGGSRKVAKSDDYGVATGDYQLQAECAGGRKITVTFNGQKVLHYEHSRPLIGQSALLAAVPGGKVTFSDLKPGVMPAVVLIPPYNAIWTHSPRANDLLHAVPTAWRGVFRRDDNNNVYLTGFQRHQKPLFDMATSWYQRGAPVVIGVKDRGPIPGQNMHAAITEVALRVMFNRETKKLYGRLGMEVHVPENNPAGTSTSALPPELGEYYINAHAQIVGGNYLTVYTKPTGGPPIENNLTLKPGQFFKMKDSVSVTGRHTFIFSPNSAASTGNGFLQLSTADIPLINGDNSLTDIRIENLKLAIEGEIRVGFRVVDYFNVTLEMPGQAKFANPAPLDSEWPFIPKWEGKTDDYSKPDNRLVIYNNKIYALLIPTLPKNPDNQSPDISPKWKLLSRDLRKIEISWQANDPLVNSHGSDFKPYFYRDPVGGNKVYGYSPPYMENGSKPMPVNDILPPLHPGANWQTYRQWMPFDEHNKPAEFSGGLPYKHNPVASASSPHVWKLGVNLALKNDATEHWGKGTPDSTIKDPGVGITTKAPHLDWRFPDISRKRIENVGWLGQVHRGTPWQTLYLKSREPGLINTITAVNDGIVTAPNHNIRKFDRVQLKGKLPVEWEGLAITVDSEGNIEDGELMGFAQPIDANRFRIWPTGSVADWTSGTDKLPAFQVFDTTELMVQNAQYWKDWADSSDAMPANDRRLLEVFSVGTGVPVRGRFSVNNHSEPAWSAVLSGLSVPARMKPGTMEKQLRILGANQNSNADYGRIDLKDNTWPAIVGGINKVRPRDKVTGVVNKFTRVTDILATPKLSDESPYLPFVWNNTLEGFKDELDLERIPMQLLSLLRVDEQPLFVTYICAEKLRPALQVKIIGFPVMSAKSEDGPVLNYEVAGQTARRVLYRLSNAKKWHRSIKNNHLGKWRDKNGNLQDLPPLRPVILQSRTLEMDSIPSE